MRAHLDGTSLWTQTSVRKLPRMHSSAWPVCPTITSPSSRWWWRRQTTSLQHSHTVRTRSSSQTADACGFLTRRGGCCHGHHELCPFGGNVGLGAVIDAVPSWLGQASAAMTACLAAPRPELKASAPRQCMRASASWCSLGGRHGSRSTSRSAALWATHDSAGLADLAVRVRDRVKPRSPAQATSRLRRACAERSSGQVASRSKRSEKRQARSSTSKTTATLPPFSRVPSRASRSVAVGAWPFAAGAHRRVMSRSWGVGSWMARDSSDTDGTAHGHRRCWGHRSGNAFTWPYRKGREPADSCGCRANTDGSYARCHKCARLLRS